MRELPAVDEPTTFTETAIREAAARRARVDLVLDPVTPETDRRLISRMLGINTDGDVVLEVPKTNQARKVFIPAGWQLGMAFEVVDVWMQSRSIVLGHCQFPIRPGRRVDALTVKRPEKIVSCNQRRKPRWRGDPLNLVSATILAIDGRECQDAEGPSRVARLRDWSEGGLGLQFVGSHDLEAGVRVLVRLWIASLGKSLLLTGVVKHVTPLAPEASLVGVGDVEEAPAGQTACRLGSAWSGVGVLQTGNPAPEQP